MPGIFDLGVYDTDVYGSPSVPRVRELPPLRQHLEAVTPSGRHYRWGEDEPDAINVPSGLRHSSTMPGGYESLDVTLPRKPGIDYSDLERLTTINVWGAGGNKCGEYRLERVPRTSGDQVSVSPSAVGWQAHLEDDKSASMIYIDRDLSKWRGPSVGRQISLDASGVALGELGVVGGIPASLRLSMTGAWANATGFRTEAYYDGPPSGVVAFIGFDWTVNNGNATFSFNAYPTDDEITFDTASSDPLAGALSGTFSFTTPTPRRMMLGQFAFATPGGADGSVYFMALSNVRVCGDHGLALSGVSPDEGLLAGDVVTHAVERWAPLLNITTESIQASSFVIPHLAFYELTTAGEIVRQASRFGLQPWGVWNNREFWWGADRGRSWRARIGPAQLEEAGPQLDRLWNSVMVQYQDVDGSTRTVGPIGSGADAESTDLMDADPDNPATLFGITRRERLAMGVSTAMAAIEVGRRFLEESKVLDSSGRARLVGHVMDDRGVLHPYFSVQAGDTIVFSDAADTSPRRIIKADHDRASRTCSIDLDAPPEGLAALLERLGVVLVPLGV